MERNRNWLGLIALVLGGLALVVALGGRFGPRMAYSYQLTAPAAPAAPDTRSERDRGGPPAFFSERAERMGRGAEGFAPRHGAMMDRGFDRGHGLGMLGFFFGLVGAVTKLVALGMLAWLLLRLFQQRRGGAPPTPPTTPAGHDPRVE